jgi:hypothetical protein
MVIIIEASWASDEYSIQTSALPPRKYNVINPNRKIA